MSTEQWKAEYERLAEAVRFAIDYAGGRESEWGERAEECFRILETAVSRKTEHPQPAEDMALLKKPEPQPQKTRVRLWMRNDPRGRPSLFACDQKPLAESEKYVEIHHDSEGFYVEGGQS